MIKDLQSNVRVVRCIDPIAIGTTGTGKTGKVVDRQGYGGVEFVLAYGTVTATNAAFTATVFEGDVTGTLTSVADANLLPSVTPELLAGVAAQATARTSGVGKNVTKRVGYIGNKRYVNVKVSSTVTAAPPISVSAILHNPYFAPVANP